MEKINVTRATLPPYEDYIEKIRPIWDSAWMTNMGEFHKELEEELKKYLQVKNISLFTNGHLSLELLIQALTIHGEIITTPFTFVSTSNAIVRNGLRPVFCDIKEEDYTIDAAKIEELITDKTSAILPVHVYGTICDIEKIEEIGKKYNLKVIYDAAHAFGETYRGIGIGNYGDASMFSFHSTKVYNTIEGGALTFSSEKMKDILYQLKNFGIVNEEEIKDFGTNAKMNEFQAAMGLCNLKYIEENIVQRKKIFEYYYEKLQDIEGIQLKKSQKDTKSNYSYFPVQFNPDYCNRNRVYDKLIENRIFSRKYFYPALNDLECYRKRFVVNETPVARKVSEQILTLPLYPTLGKEQIDLICNIIRGLKGVK